MSPDRKGPGDWCPENDGAYQAEMAAIHGKHKPCVKGCKDWPCTECGKGF